MGRGCHSTSDEVKALAGQDDVPTSLETLLASPHILGMGCSPSAGGSMPYPDLVSPVTPAVDIVAVAAGGTSQGVAASSSRTMTSTVGLEPLGCLAPSRVITAGAMTGGDRPRRG
jgi:hypothetical protein